MSFEKWLEKSTYDITPNGVHASMYRAMKAAFEAGEESYRKFVSRVMSGDYKDEDD